MSAERLCVNCRYFERGGARCESPDRDPDTSHEAVLHRLVFGGEPRLKFIRAIDARGVEMLCGVRGRWFQEREKTALERMFVRWEPNDARG